MEADNSDDEYTPIIIAYWGEKRHQQGMTTWGDERGWKSLKISNNVIKEGCIGSGSLHRTGKNYKPVGNEPTRQQPKDIMTNTSRSLQESGIGTEGSDSNSNDTRSTIYSNMDDKTQQYSMGKTCPLSPVPSQSSINYSNPLLTPKPATAVSLENVGWDAGPIHTDSHAYDQQKNIPELGSTAWKDWAKKSNEANKHMTIGLGFDSNYTVQLGDKRRSPPLSDIAALDDDDFWNKINLSMQSNSSSNNNKDSSSSSSNNNKSSSSSSNNNKNSSSNNNNEIRHKPKAVDLLSSPDDASPSLSPSSSRKYRFADHNRQRYSTQIKQSTRPHPQNYYDTVVIAPPDKIAAPPPSHNPIVVSQQLELEVGRKVTIEIRQQDDPAIIARTLCRKHSITSQAQIHGLVRLLTRQKTTAMQHISFSQ